MENIIWQSRLIIYYAYYFTTSHQSSIKQVLTYKKFNCDLLLHKIRHMCIFTFHYYLVSCALDNCVSLYICDTQSHSLICLIVEVLTTCHTDIPLVKFHRVILLLYTYVFFF